MKYTINQIASVVNGKALTLQDDAEIRELLLDSRRIGSPSSSLFFALRGPRRDGHTFIKELYTKGVRNFVVSKAPQDELAGANIVLVDDVLVALQELAAYHRNQFNIPIIGITGSNGKTIVKEWLNQLLDDRYNIVRSPKSYNSQIGVPVSVWQLNESATLGLFEAGISQAGEMKRLQKIIRPTIGVFTNIGEAHASGFEDLHQKIKEKLTLFGEAKVLIYCSDYPELSNALYEEKASYDLFDWSRSHDAQLRVSEIVKLENNTSLTVKYKTESFNISIPFTDDASIENAITCLCVLLYLQVPVEEIKTRLKGLHAVAMRLELRDGINNSSIINDSYSADLSSLKIALDFLSQQHQHPKRMVILADFLESGLPEKELYADIARLLQQHQIDRLIGIGPVITRNSDAFTYPPAGIVAESKDAARGFEAQFFASVEEFTSHFHRIHFGNETVLIKGARVFALEEINRMLEKQTHQTQLEIDLNALVHNLKSYHQLLKPSTKMMAMVKAFSYGSGSYEIASALQFNKVDYLAVAYADEGVELRKGGITLPVMVMNPDESSFNTLVDYNLEPDMYSLALIKSFLSFLKNEGLSQYPVHLELETGMNRLGFSESDLGALSGILAGPTLRVQSVFSHLVASEDPAFDDFTRRQAALFESMSEVVSQAVNYQVTRHLLNTSGISRHATLQYDMVRIGIGLYGIDPGNPELKPVSALKTAIAQVKEIRAGESVGYGRSGRVSRVSRIATVRLGYADGYPRSLGNGNGKMLVNGQLVPTIGNICMDMTMLDITGAEKVDEGDEVEVFGKSLSVQEVARWAGTIPYEILTGVSQRVKRVYFQE